jgi:hypothetical protein
MFIELFGGPLDGAVLTRSNYFPIFLVVDTHPESPIYKAQCCRRCGENRTAMAYQFLGYEQVIRYEYPEKSKEIRATQQEEIDI